MGGEKAGISLRAPRTLGLILLIPLLAGCTSLRLKDDQRLKTAQAAAALTEQLRAPESDPFSAMAKNLQAVAEARAKIDELLDQARQDTFQTSLPALTREALVEELASALDLHLQAKADLEGQSAAAAAQVKETLERQALITKTLGAIPDAQLATVLAEVERRQQWLARLLADIARVSQALDLDPEARKKLGQAQGAVAGVGQFLGGVARDPKVAAAQRLLLQAGQEVAVAEGERLAEMRRHLTAVERLGEGFARRHQVYVNTLFAPALRAVAGPSEAAELFQQLGLDPPDPEILDNFAAFQADWCPGCTLLDFVTAKLGKTGTRDGIEAMKFVAELGVILFVEEPLDRKAELHLASERHLHSIRLSQINGQQKLDLIGQVVQGLQIYYQGGIEPAQVAQLVLLASQVVATGFIGSRL